LLKWLKEINPEGIFVDVFSTKLEYIKTYEFKNIKEFEEWLYNVYL
jgi:hypothetical protein